MHQGSDGDRGQGSTGAGWSPPRPPLQPMMESVGAQVRSLRQARGMTLEQMSERAGVSTGLLSQIERGRGNPSFNSLVQIAHALNAPVARLLEEDDDDSPVVRRHNRRRLDPHTDEPNSAKHELLTPSLNHAIEVIWVEAPPGYSTEGTPYVHRGEEVGVILEGRHEVHVGGTCHELGPGDAITFPSSRPHWYRNPGPDPVEAIWIITPPTF